MIPTTPSPRPNCDVMQIVAAALRHRPDVLPRTRPDYRSGPAPGPRLGAAERTVLTVLAAALFVISTAAAFVVPDLAIRNRLRRIASGAEPDAVAQVRALPMTAMIIGRALHEGAAFLGCIAYLMEAHPVALGVAGLSILLMLLPLSQGIPRQYVDAAATRMVGASAGAGKAARRGLAGRRFILEE